MERNERVLEIFREITKVPRNSKSEEKIADYICGFAKNLGLEYRKDEMFNVVVKKKATVGMENKKKIMFQAHTDMVCVKRENAVHDFENDPIVLIENDDVIAAKDTTLGADDGIGCAIMMYLMESNEPLPEATFVFTTQEEIGMHGARALDYSDIEADYLINLDGEEENTAIVGCAGGVSVHYDKLPKLQSIDPLDSMYELIVDGLYGGHSGVDINKGRINSNYLAASILKDLKDIKIVSFVGGTKDNAIPNSTRVVFSSEMMKLEIDRKIKDIVENIKTCREDQHLNVTAEYYDAPVSDTLDNRTSNSILNLITTLKQGVIEMNEDVEDLVETSGNVGIVDINLEKIHIVESLRSSVDKKRINVTDENNKLAQDLGFSVEEEGDYPGWKYNPNSKIQEEYKEAYIKVHGEEPIVCAIHAGVECGMIYEKMPNLDMISLGPDVVDVHTPSERLFKKSCVKLMDTLMLMIENLD